jgi:hypothetical protein
MTDRERLSKVLAIAINPGSYEQEAVAALRRARELVKLDPTLAHPPPAPPEPAQLPSAGEHSVETKVVSIPPFWLTIFLTRASEQAYKLGLKSRILCDFSAVPVAVDVRCDGAKEACDAFLAHLDWLIEYINSPSATRWETP